MMRVCSATLAMLAFASVSPMLGASALAQDRLNGDPSRGAMEFERVCSACHTIQDGGRRRVGPNVYGVIGSRIASKSGYPYSEAFKASDIVWDEATLAAFLEAPGRVVPGTKMDWTVRNPQTIADFIAYMRGFGP
jgi:cytochrome c